MNKKVDFGLKPGMMPPPMQTRRAVGNDPKYIELACAEWSATYKWAYRRKDEIVYNLFRATVVTKENKQGGG